MFLKIKILKILKKMILPSKAFFFAGMSEERKEYKHDNQLNENKIVLNH